MANGFGGIAGYILLRKLFVTENKRRLTEYVIKRGWLGGFLATLLRGIFITFILKNVSFKIDYTVG